MSGLWLPPLHSGLAGHDWLMQILVIALIAGVWLFAAGMIERQAENRRRRGIPRPRIPGRSSAKGTELSLQSPINGAESRSSR